MVAELESRISDTIPQKDEKPKMKPSESILNQPSYQNPIEESKMHNTITVMERAGMEHSPLRHS